MNTDACTQEWRLLIWCIRKVSSQAALLPPSCALPALSPPGPPAVGVQALSHVRLFVAPWPAAYQASLSFTVSRSLLTPMSFELVMPSNHLILCRPLLSLPSILPSTASFPKNQCFALASTGASASASVLPMSIQDWFPLGLTGLISLLSKRLSRIFSSTAVQKLQFFSA